MNIESEATAPCQLHGLALRQAERRARNSLREDALDGLARTVLARAHFDRGDEFEAIRLLEEAIYLDSSCVVAYELLVDAYERRGRHAEAVSIYKSWAIEVFRRQLADSKTSFA